MTNVQRFSFALVSRFQFCETPFLNEFINYYCDLGIDHFYLINTEPQNYEQIHSKIVQEYLQKISIINNDTGEPIRQCQNLALPFITETFTLHVDLDEFLYLNGKTLMEFITEYVDGKNNPIYGAFTFRWVMSPCYKYLCKQSIKDILSDNYFFPSRERKTMALTAMIKEMKRSHFFRYKNDILQKDINVSKQNIFIFHLSSRGIYDIINKTQFQFFPLKRDANPAKELHQLIFNNTSTQLPNRFVLLAFQSRFLKHTLPLSYTFPDLKYTTDTELLESITLEGLRRLLGRDVNNQDLHNITRKLENFHMPSDLVDQYATFQISLKQVIKYIKPSRRLSIKMKLQRFYRNLMKRKVSSLFQS